MSKWILAAPLDHLLLSEPQKQEVLRDTLQSFARHLEKPTPEVKTELQQLLAVLNKYYETW